MSFFELVRIVFGNLRRMIFRVMLTAAGVLIGTFAVIILVSIGNGLQVMATQSLGSAGELNRIEVNNYSFDPSSEAQPITERKIDSWRQLEGVIGATPIIRLQANGQLQYNRSTTFASITGIDPTQIDALSIEFAEGNGRLAEGQIVVGPYIGESFFNEQIGRQTDPIDLYGKTLQLVLTKQNSDGTVTERRERLRVAGVLEESGGQSDWSIYMTLKEVRGLNEWATGRRFDIRRDGYETVYIQAEQIGYVERIESVIGEEGYQTSSLQRILREMRVVFGGIQVAFGCIGSIALLVAAIGIANTMIMAIYERTREIGLMKAVGATNRDVMLIFLGEAGTIGLIGGTLGILLALLVGQVGGAVAVNYMQTALDAPADIASPVNTPLWLILFALVFSTLIGIISGIYPAIRAVQLDPMMALKYE